MTLSQVIYAAAREARILKGAGRGLSLSELADGLIIANQLVDEWAARKAYAYDMAFTAYTLTPNHQPHLIGPGLAAPDFAVAVRPQRVESAALILTTVTPNVDFPLTLRDHDWWADQRVKGLATSVPTDLVYHSDWPNGELWLWPAPTFAYGIRLQTWNSIQQFAVVTSPFSAPPAYQKAFTLTMAEQMCAWWGVEPPTNLSERAARARLSVQSNNIKSPRIASADQGTNGGRRGFNYYSGGPA